MSKKMGENQHIQVFVRVRPLSSSEKSDKSHNVVELTDRELVIKERPHERFTRKYAFDRVFGPNSTQIEVYMAVVHPVISEVIAGYSCTVFAYGQTGTGKTFTMEGEKSKGADTAWNEDPLSGIIPRALSQLFDELNEQQVEFIVRVSFLEMYNEELIDLLSCRDDVSKLRLYEDSTKKGSVIVQGLEQLVVHDKNEVYAIMEKASNRKQTASTLMNANSSRSHTIFSITIHIKENTVEGGELLKTGKLNLVDLAGSENIGRSGSMNARAREAGNINQSLLTLGRVITALVEKAPHVPYRESKLTRLLQDSLGGRTRTSILATISPAANSIEETRSTLDYAHRAKNITNKPEVNQKMTKKTLIKEYTSEISQLRKELAAAREKSGVHIAYDDYRQMIEQIEQTEQLRSQLKEQKEICDQQHMSLEDFNSKLASTYHKLEDSKQELIKQINEKTHLIDNHVETEQALSAQAQSLLTVADIATTDTDKLHDKLKRKRSIETTNEDITRNFHVSFVQNVANMEDSINRFTQDLIKFCSGFQTKLGERLEKRSSELASFSNEMSSFVDSRTQQIQNLEEMFSNQVYNGQQWIQQYLTTVCSTSDSEVNNLHKFLTDLFLAPVRNLSHQLQLVEADTKAMGSTVVEQVKQNLYMVKDFDASLKTSLSQLRKSVLSQFNLLQQQALESSESSIRAMDEVTQSYEKKLAAQAQQLRSLADSILNEHGAFKIQYNENKSQLRNGVTVTQEKCDHLSQLTTAVIDQQLNSRNEQLNTYETQAEELLDSVSNCRHNVEQSLVGARGLEDEMENNVRMFVANGEKAWRNHYSVTEQELRKYSENLNVDLQKGLKVTQDLMSGLRESAESHEAILEQQRIDFGTFVQECQNDLDSQCSYVNHWNQVIVPELQQRTQDLDKFLQEDLRKDVPTGGTPERKAFKYPRKLAATLPHERILARFRAGNYPPAPLNIRPEDSPKTSTSSSNKGNVPDADSWKDARGAIYRAITDITNRYSSGSSQRQTPKSRRSDNKENEKSLPMKTGQRSGNRQVQ